MDVVGSVSAVATLAQLALCVIRQIHQLRRDYRTVSSRIDDIEAHMIKIRTGAVLAHKILKKHNLLLLDDGGEDEAEEEDKTGLAGLFEENIDLVRELRDQLDWIRSAGDAKRFGKQILFFRERRREVSVRGLLKRLRWNQKDIQNRLNYLSSDATHDMHRVVYRLDEHQRSTNLSLNSLHEGQTEIIRHLSLGKRDRKGDRGYGTWEMVSTREVMRYDVDHQLQKQRKHASVFSLLTAIAFGVALAS